MKSRTICGNFLLVLNLMLISKCNTMKHMRPFLLALTYNDLVQKTLCKIQTKTFKHIIVHTKFKLCSQWSLMQHH